MFKVTRESQEICLNSTDWSKSQTGVKKKKHVYWEIVIGHKTQDGWYTSPQIPPRGIWQED